MLYAILFFTIVDTHVDHQTCICLIQTVAEAIVIGQWLVAWLSGCWSFPDLWLTCDHFVGKVSTVGQHPGQLSLSSLQGSQMSSNACNYIITWIMRMETIKWKTLPVCGSLATR